MAMVQPSGVALGLSAACAWLAVLPAASVPVVGLAFSLRQTALVLAALPKQNPPSLPAHNPGEPGTGESDVDRRKRLGLQ